MTKYFELMSVLALILGLFFVFKNQTTNAQNANNSDFVLNLTVINNEVSKDSHTDTYNVKITGRNLEYSWVHTGFPGKEQDSYKYELSEKNFKKLIKHIKENRLNKNLRENKKTDYPGISVNLNLQIQMNGKKTKMSIGGMRNIFGESLRKPSNIGNLKYYERANSIINYVKNDWKPIQMRDWYDASVFQTGGVGTTTFTTYNGEGLTVLFNTPSDVLSAMCLGGFEISSCSSNTGNETWTDDIMGCRMLIKNQKQNFIQLTCSKKQ